jgi:hypothetical protein
VSSSNLQQPTAIHHHSRSGNNKNQIHQNEINKLLIEKQMQQQLSQTSLSIINDPMQSKSLRRTHKQAYDMSLQKIEQLNENLNHLQIATAHYHQPSPTSTQQMMKAQDDIDLHRSDNRYVKNALAMVGNNSRNLHMLNMSNTMSMSERRNSMKSTTSSIGSTNTFIIQSSPSSATSLTSLKTLSNSVMAHSPRTRQDGKFSQYDYEFHQRSNDSPTPSAMSMQHPSTQQINHQIPLCSQSLKNIKINTDYHHHSQHHSPQIQQPQQQQQISPHFYVQNNHNSSNSNFAYPQQAQPQFAPPPRQNPPNDHKFIQRLHSFNHQLQHDRNQIIGTSLNGDDMRVKIVPKYQTNANNFAAPSGLGGYWTINENNQRVWIADSKYPISPPSAPASNMVSLLINLIS